MDCHHLFLELDDVWTVRMIMLDHSLAKVLGVSGVIAPLDAVTRCR